MKTQLFNLKRLMLILATGLLSMGAFAQMQIGNADFENWDNVGSSSEEPVNWSSFMTADCTLGAFVCSLAKKQQVERSTDAHSGLYSARIWSKNPIGSTIANGNMTLGRVRMGSSTPASSDNFNYTDISDSDFNQVLTDKPDSLVVWVKFNPKTASDMARVSATIHDSYNYRDPEDANAEPHVVAKAVLNYPSTNGEWVRLSIPFDYSGPSTDAQYILITFTTNMTPGGGKKNDEVFIDDLELIYNVNELDISPISDQLLVENELGTELTANETPKPGSSVTSRQWKYATTSGGPYTNTITGETGTTYTPQFSTAGTYYVVCETDFEGDILTSNEVKVQVMPFTIFIDPAADQSLITNQQGNTITVTENATADSRQWKYSTTQGGPYTTDITGETGTAYIPEFSTNNTYYVVCESTFGSSTVTSNEVKVEVTPFIVYILPNTTQNLVENQSGTDLEVTENATADSRQWKYATTAGGPYTNDITGETGTTYTPQFAASGTYYVICESTFQGNNEISNEVEINVTAAVSNTVSISPTSTQNLIENQLGTDLTASETPGAADSREWKYSTTSGSGYTSFTTPETGTTYTPQFVTADTYYVVCISDFGGGDIDTSNEVEIVVEEFTASIDPAATQNLIETQIGDELTVTETPTADSREWKYTATSGSGYTSFTTPETGTTYSPEFATAGTYYVVCESTIDGVIETSNEVEVVVEEFTTSIDPSTTQTIEENEMGTELSVTETPTADSREWKFSTTSGSGYTSFTSAETGTTYTPLFSTAGTYYVVCESDIDGITVLSNEVTVVVEPTVGLSSNEITSFAVYASDQKLNVDFSNVDIENATLKVLSVDGKVIAKQALKNKQLNSVQLSVPTGIYFYSINNGKKFYQGKVFIK